MFHKQRYKYVRQFLISTIALVAFHLAVGPANAAGTLAGTVTSATSLVNLTTEGKTDWVHWGDSSLVRKASVSAALSTYTVVGGGTVASYSDDPRPSSWTDGTPLASASNNKNGLFIAGTGRGFSITAPADTTNRTLVIHVGGWNSSGTLTAHLSDGSVSDFKNTTASTNGSYDANYTLIYQASSAGQKITVTWIMAAGAGNITLNAAALTAATTTPPPPTGALSGTANTAVSLFSLTTEGGADWIHWGDASVTRKKSVTAALSTYTVVGGGTASTYSNDRRPLSWTDGTSIASASNNTNGVFVTGVGRGFSVTAPADTTTRTLVIHVGGWNSSGKLTAHLSDSSAADFTNTTASSTGQYDQNYTLTYRAASAGKTITITWTLVSGAGNVTLSAAALAGTSTPTNPTDPTNPTNPPPPTQGAIVLPIEVMGSDGTTKAVSFTLPSSSGLSGSASMYLQIHGLEYETEGSIQLNGGSWIALNNQTAKVIGLAKNHGGISGGFSTLPMTVPVPANSLKAGSNTITFRFNATDGNSSGYRVLAFNVQLADGSQLLAQSSFTQDDPSQWKPPLTSSSDIAAGQILWRSANLVQPVGGGATQSIKAHCGDCHAADGRDLKYFNYSNNTIRIRSMFHGLTSTQADQIASYIRTLSTPAPSQARPWNPPYQPGPGTDSKPVGEWAAGAGLSAILNSDQDMLPYVAPTLTAADFNPKGNLSIRNTPIPFQLLDWNHWLPTIYPADAYGQSFLQSTMYADYGFLNSVLMLNNPNQYSANADRVSRWTTDAMNFFSTLSIPSSTSASWSTPSTAQKLYSIFQWETVKTWEINQVFGLEGMAQSAFGPQADSRAWYSNAPFRTSPTFLEIPGGAAGIQHGSKAGYDSVSNGWYYLQVILNHGNKVQGDNNPVDWQYLYNDISLQAQYSSPQAIMYLAVLTKALQDDQNGAPPTAVNGWSLSRNDPSVLVRGPNMDGDSNIWASMPITTPSNIRSALLNSYMTQWLAAVRQWTPQQFYNSGQTSQTETNLNGGQEWAGTVAARVGYTIPRLHFLGVSDSLTMQLANWAATMWPKYNWNAYASATCTPRAPDYAYLDCSTDPK
jgi:hypothetical protein